MPNRSSKNDPVTISAIVMNRTCGSIAVISPYPADISRLLDEEQVHGKRACMEGVIRQMWLQSPDPSAVAILEADSTDVGGKSWAGEGLTLAGVKAQGPQESTEVLRHNGSS